MTTKEIFQNDTIGNIVYHILESVFRHIIVPIFWSRSLGMGIAKLVSSIIIIILLYAMVFGQFTDNEVIHGLFPLTFIFMIIYVLSVMLSEFANEN